MFVVARLRFNLHGHTKDLGTSCKFGGGGFSRVLRPHFLCRVLPCTIGYTRTWRKLHAYVRSRSCAPTCRAQSYKLHGGRLQVWRWRFQPCVTSAVFASRAAVHYSINLSLAQASCVCVVAWLLSNLPCAVTRRTCVARATLAEKVPTACCVDGSCGGSCAARMHVCAVACVRFMPPSAARIPQQRVSQHATAQHASDIPKYTTLGEFREADLRGRS